MDTEVDGPSHLHLTKDEQSRRFIITPEGSFYCPGRRILLYINSDFVQYRGDDRPLDEYDQQGVIFVVEKGEVEKVTIL